MLVPFGTHVVDREGKSVGTVSRLVLGPLSEEVVALVVQQGVLNRREVVVPINKGGPPLAPGLGAGRPRSLQRAAAQADARPLEDAARLRPAQPVPRRGRRLDGGGAALRVDVAARLGTSREWARQLSHADGFPVPAGKVGNVRVWAAPDVFHTETAIPASLIASVGDTIQLDVSADEVKRLERSLTDQLGTAPSRQRAG